MTRLDKFLVDCNVGTRSMVDKYIKQGRVLVDGVVQKRKEIKIDPKSSQVQFDGIILVYEEFVYYILNKPAGIISASNDNKEQTVIDLILDRGNRKLFPVGRLDRDTTGVLLITDNGDMAHNMLHPKKHVSKIYKVTPEHELSDEDIDALCKGVDIGEDIITAPAEVARVDDSIDILLTIHEGKFHQVKRMLEAVGNKVECLDRVQFGPIRLDPAMERGSYRRLTDSELEMLSDYL